MKAMAYIKKTACDDLTLGEFSAEWKALTEPSGKPLPSRNVTRYEVGL